MCTWPLFIMITRISTTESADKLIDELTAQHGELMFHQSGGCCDGSAPMCYTKGEFYLGNADVEIGTVRKTPFYMSAEQFAYWEHTHITLDAIKGTGSAWFICKNNYIATNTKGVQIYLHQFITKN